MFLLFVSLTSFKDHLHGEMHPTMNLAIDHTMHLCCIQTMEV